MAKSRIAGLTIEIGGDTSDLQKALKGVDAQLKTTQGNLKDIDKLLKLDPGNTELLAQKQKNLAEAIKDTEDRLKTLRDAQKNATSPEDYDRLQREIIATEQDLKGLKQQYKDFGSVASQKLKVVGESLQNAGKKVMEFGAGWTKHITAPIAAVGVAAYAAFNEVDEGMDTIIKKTDATGKALDSMGDIMKEIATEIPTDFATAGEAVGEVNTRFGANGEQLKDLSAQYIKFAKINDTDVTGAIDSTQKALSAFGKDADDAGAYLDHLTKVSQATGISVDKLAAGAVQNSTAFKEMDLSLYGATTLMGQLELSGADSSAVLGGLSKALKTATKDGKPMKQALEELQSAILNGTDSTDGLTMAYDLFGKSGAQVYEAVRSGALDFTNLSNTADGLADTVSQTFEATLDPADRFQVAMNAIKATGAEIAEVVMPILSEALLKVRDFVLDLKARWDGLDESHQKTILTVAGVVAAIGPVITAVGGLISGIGSVIGLLSGPAGIAVAIGAVIAAGVYLVKHWDEVKEKAKELWGKVVDFANDAWKAIRDIDWAELGRKVWNWITAAFKSISGWARQTFDKAVAAIKAINWKQVGTDVWNWIVSAFAAISAWARETFDKAVAAIKSIDWKKVGADVWSWIVSAFAAISAWARETFDKAVAAIKAINWKQVGETVWRWITDAFSAVYTWADTTFNRAVQAIREIDWVQVGRTVWDWITSAFSGIYSWGKEIFGKAVDAIRDIDWIELGESIWSWIKVGVGGWFSDTYNNVSNWFGDVFTDAFYAITNIDWEDVGDAIWTKISNALRGIGEWLIDVFTTPINAVIDLVNGMIGGVESAVNAVINGINSALTLDWNITNPFTGNSLFSLKWSPNIGNVSWGRIQKLATGGILSEGQRAIVGEYAPEYLTVRNGQAVVTPMKNTGRFGGDTVNNTFNIYQQPGQSAQQLAAEVQRVMVRQLRQREAAYA